jgi:AcrR family transcriptional regulator
MSQPRKLRRDAAENAERLLAAAVRAGLAEGRFVPLETVAAEAGVGIATLYRRYPNREALLEALAVRAYHLILAEAEDALTAGETGHDAVRRFLEQTFVHRDQLVLPLHGAPLSEGTESAELRARMQRTMAAIVGRGHRDGTVRRDVDAGTVVRFGAMLAHPMPNVADWPAAAADQRAVFLRGIATEAGPSA